LPPSSASAAAAAADGSDAEAATDGDGAGEEGEEAGVVTDAMPPGEGVDWALSGWTVVVAGVAAPSLGAGAKARLGAAAEGLIVAVRPQPPAPVPADGMQETVSLAADTDGEADGRVRGEPGGGDADAAAEAHDDDAASVGSGAAPPAAATGAAPPPPRCGYMPAAEQAVGAIYAFDGAPEERLRRALGAVDAAIVGAAAPPPAAATAPDDDGGGGGGADASSVPVDAACVCWLLHLIGHGAMCQPARVEGLVAAFAAADRRRTAAAAAGGADDAAGGGPAPAP